MNVLKNAIAGLTIAAMLIAVPVSHAADTSPIKAPESTAEELGKIAPKPLFRDKIHDGAADPVLCWNTNEKKWFMFYTNRRADVMDEPGVSWVHGTRIGIAESSDGGATWTYRGTAEINYGEKNFSHWAPEVLEHDGTWHMFLTVVPGTFSNWSHPRDIVHLTSKDLLKWDYSSTLKLASDRVIDACVYRLPDGTWRMWYNNEPDGKSIYYADSPDLYTWTDRGKAVGERSGEGPKVFRWKDRYWMVVDVWKGLGVYSSDDLLKWKRQQTNLLEKPGSGTDDKVIGGHPDVVVSGERAFLFYFTHPGRQGPDARKDGFEQRRSSIQVVELEYSDGAITCDRDRATRIRLLPPLPPLPPNARLELNENWSSGEIDANKWYPLQKKWGRGNHGVVKQNIRLEKDFWNGKEQNVLVCVAHGDKYQGPVKGFGGNTRVGGVLVSKEFFASGRYEVVLKIGSATPHTGGPENPTRPVGTIPAIWTYGYRYISVPNAPKGHFSKENPLYNPFMQLQGKGANEYWSEIDFPEFGKEGNFDKALYNTFLQNRHHPCLFDVSMAIDGQYHILTTEWRTELKPIEGVCDSQVIESEGFWWIQDKTIPFEHYLGNPLKRLDKDSYVVYAGEKAEHWIDNQKVAENRTFVPAMTGQLNIGIWLPEWAGPAPWETAQIAFASVKVWRYDDPGDVRGILTQDIPCGPVQ